MFELKTYAIVMSKTFNLCPALAFADDGISFSLRLGYLGGVAQRLGSRPLIGQSFPKETLTKSTHQKPMG